MVDKLKIVGNELWLIATLCLFLMTSSAFQNIYPQEAKRVTNGKSPSNMALPSLPAGKASSGTTSLLNNSSDGSLTASNSTHFLKYNNLGNNYNKAASTSYNFPEYSGPSSAYGRRIPSPSTHPYYYPSYNYYPYSFSTSSYPPLTSPSYYSYPQASAPFSSTAASNYPTSPSGLFPPSLFPPSNNPLQPNSFPVPPPSLFPPARDTPEEYKILPLGLKTLSEMKSQKWSRRRSVNTCLRL